MALRQVARDVVEIGRLLTEAKSLCLHGQWEKWVQDELGWKTRTARQYMQIYEVFGANRRPAADLENIETNALFTLCRSTTPAEVREQALERARQGQFVKYGEVKQQIDRFRKREERWARERAKREEIEARKTPEERAEEKRREHDQAVGSIAEDLVTALKEAQEALRERDWDDEVVSDREIAQKMAGLGISARDLKSIGQRIVRIAEEVERHGNVLAYRTASRHR